MSTEAKNEWPLWEVFVRSRSGLDHKHCGSLHASDAQHALQMARDLAGRGTAPPQVAVDLAPVAEGIGLRGTVSRLGGRNLWLFLVSPEGSVFDLTGQTAAQGKDRADLAAMISAPGGSLADGYLLVAAVSPQPLAAVAAAPAAAAADTLLPRVMAEITAQGGGAATVLRIGEAAGASPLPGPIGRPRLTPRGEGTAAGP